MASKCLRVKLVGRKCKNQGQHCVVRPHTQYVESKPICFYQNDHNSLKFFAAGYHLFTFRPEIDFNYFPLF